MQHLPHIVVAAPQRTVVRPSGTTDTIGDLAFALGATAVSVGGHVHAPSTPLVAIPALRHGATIDLVTSDIPNPDDSEADERAPVEIAVVTGPDCGPWQPLATGRHIVGRASDAHVTIADPTVEPYHALITVGCDPDRTDGSVVAAPQPWTLRQLTGGVDVDARTTAVHQLTTAARSHCADAPIALYRMGASTLAVRRRVQRLVDRHDRTRSRHAITIDGDPATIDDDPPPSRVVQSEGAPWRRVVLRSPVPPQQARPELVPPIGSEPVPWPSATGLIGAGAAVAGAAAIAGVLGQPTLALFALVGAFVALTSWAVGFVGAWRRRRRGRQDHASALARFDAAHAAAVDAARADHAATHPTVIDVLGDLDRLAAAFDRGEPEIGAPIWSRPPALRTSASSGPQRSAPVCRATATMGFGDVELWLGDAHRHRASDLALPVRLTSRSITAVCGPGAIALARSIIIQLAARLGPADLAIVTITETPERWAWTAWLPHGHQLDGVRNVITTSDHDALEALDQHFARVSTELADHARTTTQDSAGLPLTVVVTDDLEALTVRTGRVRRIIDRCGVATLAVSEQSGVAPAGATTTLELGVLGSVTATVIDGDSGSPFDASETRRRGLASGISHRTAERAARALAPLTDPEAGNGDEHVPGSLSLTELLGREALTTDGVIARWTAAAGGAPPTAPLGRAGNGRVDVDLDTNGPHGLIAGTTGSGKSELLRTLVISLALHHPPDAINFVLVDYKGGSTFDACVDLPHTVGLVTDLDDGLAERALVSFNAELHRRERLLRSVGAADLDQYRRSAGDRETAEQLPRLAVVIDEFASLARDVPHFLSALVDIAQRGRSLGVHLLLATQRPTGVVSDDIRANTNLRIALRLHDRTDAMDVIGDPAPAGLPRGVPGRALLRLGPNELVTFQVASCSSAPSEVVRDIVVERPAVYCAATGPAHDDTGRRDDHDDRNGAPSATSSELDVAVGAIAGAAQECGYPPPRRPWVAPLPALLTRAAVTSRLAEVTQRMEEEQHTPGTVDRNRSTDERCDIVGLVDEPDHQTVAPLRWDRAAGNLALIGALGSGTTTALIALVSTTCASTTPADTHVYVIDARGDDALHRLGPRPHVGAVVRTTDHERLRRLLLRLDGEIDGRIDDPAGGGRPEIILAIDGMPALRSELATLENAVLLTALARIVIDGPGVGIRSVFTAVDDTSLPPAFTTSQAWRFQRGATSAPNAPTDTSGAPAGRIHVMPSGRIAQVAVDAAIDAGHRCGDGPTADGHGDGGGRLNSAGAAAGPDSIGVLPAHVAWHDLPGVDGRSSQDHGGCEEASAWSTTRPAVHTLGLGLDADTLTVARLTVPYGDHIVVLGSGRTGVSSTLDTIAAAWSVVHAQDAVWRVNDAAALAAALDDLVVGPAAGCGQPPRLVVIDNADRIDDPDGRLGALINARRPNVTVAAGARVDVVRGLYGHWIRSAARSRCGVVLTSPGEIDGDLLGIHLTQRPPIPARPGLGWIIDPDGHRLAQLAHCGVERPRHR